LSTEKLRLSQNSSTVNRKSVATDRLKSLATENFQPINSTRLGLGLRLGFGTWDRS